MTLTKNEKVALNMLALNLYNSSNGSRPERPEDVGDVWTFALDDHTAWETLKGKTLSGTVASLVKKGLVRTYDDTRSKAERRGEHNTSTTGLTRAGYDAWLEAFPSEEV
jgi:hypothetical protein